MLISTIGSLLIIATDEFVQLFILFVYLSNVVLQMNYLKCILLCVCEIICGVYFCIFSYYHYLVNKSCI